MKRDKQFIYLKVIICENYQTKNQTHDRKKYDTQLDMIFKKYKKKND